MDLDKLTFEVTDMRTWDDLGPARRLPDGSLTWTPGVAPDVADDDEDEDFSPWTVQAQDVRVGAHTIELDMNVAEPLIEAATLGRIAAFLSGLDAADRAFREAIAEDFRTDGFSRDALVPALFHGLDPAYRAVLFPGLSDVAQVNAAAFVASLTLARVGYYDSTSERPGQEHLVIDYRFLVPELMPGAHKDPADVLLYGGRFDVTDQAVVVYAALDGGVLAVSHES